MKGREEKKEGDKEKEYGERREGRGGGGERKSQKFLKGTFLLLTTVPAERGRFTKNWKGDKHQEEGAFIDPKNQRGKLGCKIACLNRRHWGRELVRRQKSEKGISERKRKERESRTSRRKVGGERGRRDSHAGMDYLRGKAYMRNFDSKAAHLEKGGGKDPDQEMKEGEGKGEATTGLQVREWKETIVSHKDGNNFIVMIRGR